MSQAWPGETKAVSVRLEAIQLERLRRAAAELECPIGDVLWMALAEFLDSLEQARDQEQAREVVAARKRERRARQAYKPRPVMA